MEDETAQRLRIALGRLARGLRPTEASTAAGLTPTKAAVLLHAVRAERVRLAEVAVAEGLNPTLLSRTVAKLAEAGLLERTPDSEDRRAGWVEPTPAGERLAAEIRRQRTGAVQGAAGRLSSQDQAALVAALPALERLAEALGA